MTPLLLQLGFLVCLANASETAPRATAPATAATASNTEVYRRIGDVTLRMHIFAPPGHKPGDRRPGIVFFFGGGWLRGTPVQFAPQCEYFASRGMVAMSAEYRVYERHQAKVVDCVSDAQAAVRWVRANAERLGVNPRNIAAGGGSAGGHLAAATATLADLTGEGGDKAVSFRPDALVLFNPALDLTPEPAAPGAETKRRTQLLARLGAEPLKLSPADHLRKGLPPTIIFHGEDDQLIAYASMERFVDAMKAAGNRCELVGYPGQGHSFFNYIPARPRYFVDTLRKADAFLVSLGFLRGEATIDTFKPRQTRQSPDEAAPARR